MDPKAKSKKNGPEEELRAIAARLGVKPMSCGSGGGSRAQHLTLLSRDGHSGGPERVEFRQGPGGRILFSLLQLICGSMTLRDICDTTS